MHMTSSRTQSPGTNLLYVHGLASLKPSVIFASKINFYQDREARPYLPILINLLCSVTFLTASHQDAQGHSTKACVFRFGLLKSLFTISTDVERKRYMNNTTFREALGLSTSNMDLQMFKEIREFLRKQVRKHFDYNLGYQFQSVETLALFKAEVICTSSLPRRAEDNKVIKLFELSGHLYPSTAVRIRLATRTDSRICGIILSQRIFAHSTFRHVGA